MKFFKKIWYSITKIEKYPEMSAEGTKNAIKYIVGMVAFLAIIVALGITYQTYGLIKNTSKYMENNFPDISYKEGIMTTKTEQPTILKPEELEIGKIIIDLNEKTPEEINQYKNEIKEAG
ncbi:MAG: DUF1189 family protein, partial [Clostridia bacterium]